MADRRLQRQSPAGTISVKQRLAAVGLAALALFIVYGSSGRGPADAPHAVALPGISFPDIVQNILLYVPFGILAVWAVSRSGSMRPGHHVAIVAVACAYSAVMELMQTRFAARIPSLLDVIANGIGALIGALAAAPAERALGVALNGLRRTGLTVARARYALAALLAAIVIAAWYPFDVTLDVDTLSTRTAAVRHDPWLWPASGGTLVLAGTVFFVLAAVIATCLPRLGKRAGPVAAVASVVIAAAVDLGQLAMGSRPTGVAVFVSQAAGGCAGAAFAALVRATR